MSSDPEIRAIMRANKHIRRVAADLKHTGPRFAEIRDTAEWLKGRILEICRENS